MSKICIVIPNWNGADSLGACLDSLLSQSIKAHIIVVDNGSSDGSLNLLKKYPDVEIIRHSKNKGYAGGVNPGFRKAIDSNFDYVAPFNNDAIADKNWLSELVKCLEKRGNVGIATCKLLRADGKHIDSTGDYYTVWGLPYPRGRGEADINTYDNQTKIFAASGGASLYRVETLKRVGLLDEDFFAYYEDVDLSFRSQLAGWKVRYVPTSIAYHQIGATSSKVKGFTTYQTIKNLPLLFYKNVPDKYFYKVGWRFTLAHLMFFGRAITRGQIWPAIKGELVGTYYLTKAVWKRHTIQGTRIASDEYIWNMMVHDLPPNAKALRSLRTKWWRLVNRHE